MTTSDASSADAQVAGIEKVDMKVEVVVIPVSDVDRAKQFYRRIGWRLLAAGVEVSEFFHLGPDGPVPGLDPERRSYSSRARFSDPDGNTWLLQEVTTRLPGRVDPTTTTYFSIEDVAAALRRAATAHGEHEKRTGEADANWPDWYASYLVHEQAGDGLPT